MWKKSPNPKTYHRANGVMTVPVNTRCATEQYLFFTAILGTLSIATWWANGVFFLFIASWALTQTSDANENSKFTKGRCVMLDYSQSPAVWRSGNIHGCRPAISIVHSMWEHRAHSYLVGTATSAWLQFKITAAKAAAGGDFNLYSPGSRVSCSSVTECRG